MTSSTAHKPAAFIPAGFFALRTPLLSFDELLAWSDGLEGPAALNPNSEIGIGSNVPSHPFQTSEFALDDSSRLDQALAADRSRLRARLHAAMARPEVREALFVASPDLEAGFDLWSRDPESERGVGIEQALARYFLRMAGRATPFGLCASCSVGTVGNATRFRLAGRPDWPAAHPSG